MGRSALLPCNLGLESRFAGGCSAPHLAEAGWLPTDCQAPSWDAFNARPEVGHIARQEVGRKEAASPEMPRRGTRQKVSRIGARAGATRIAEYRALIRSLDQQGAALLSTQPPEPHNLAHKMTRESRPVRQIRK